MSEIRILPAVLMDLAEAAAWYDEKGHVGLGERLISAFYASLPKIERSGEAYRVTYLDFRKVIIRPFPYSVYFRRHDAIWVVVLVIHAAREPSLAHSLLRDRRST
ncbi:MAG: hypothetical protein ABIT37_11460 [Luteolibacter sp.]